MPRWNRIEKKLRRGIDLARIEAARALGVWGGERAIPLLLDATRDVDERVRVEALRSLARLKVDQAREAFLDALVGGRTSEQRAGIDGLAAIRAKDTETVVAGFLDSSDDELVAAAIRGLGRVTEVRLPVSVVHLADDPRDEIRAAVQCALFECPDRDAIPAVRAALTDRSELVRSEAIWAALAVARREPTLLVPRLLDPSAQIASQALDALAVLCGHLPLEGYGPIARAWIPARDREALASRVLEVLPEVEDRFDAAWFDVVRFRAAEGDRAVIEDLKWAVVNEKDCRAVAVEELAKLDFDAALPRFREIAGGLFERAAVRIAANAALTRFGDRAGATDFMRSLASRREEIRGFACECAPWTKSEAVTLALRAQKPNPDSLVALGKIGDRASLQILEETAVNVMGDRDFRVDAIWSLANVAGSLSSPALERLATADADSVVREAAARALVLMGVETVAQSTTERSHATP
ncbi:MAG: HEAT repeat domain-containing protein [Deltaproteobacteria bacterium]|nr:HEAT repeat domain-containing protein [Deltaproteobacteria bacterium]